MHSADPPEINCAETAGERRFLHSELEEGANWTDTRHLALMGKAAREGGVLTTSELHTCGFSDAAITRALRRGLLTRWARGVYLVGPITDALTQARAAAKAVPRGVLGFQVAAQLARIGPSAVPPLSVIVPPGHSARARGVKLHRIELTRQDVMRRDGLMVTTPDVTLVHLARVLPAVPFERAVQEAFAKRLTNAAELQRAMTRHRPSARLRRMLELGVDDLRSKAERSLRHWVRQAGLGPVSFNAEVGPWRVDALFGRLAVEVNGYAAHSSPWAHDRDHRKEQWLRANGYDLRRFTALQAIDEPALVIAQIAAALARSGSA